jgi:hypothetical protein
MQFPISGLERSSKLLINQNIKIRTISAQFRASEKRGVGENERTFYAVGAVHGHVRKIPPLLGIFVAPSRSENNWTEGCWRRGRDSNS